MAKINPEQLPARLKNSPSPVYWISGDEPLLVQECAQAVRRYARSIGFEQREVYHTQASFRWDEMLQSANNLSLFAQKKILELRLHSLKIGDGGSRALQAYASRPPEDTLLLLISEKIDRATGNSAWAKQLDNIGTIVTVWPVREQQLPRWIDRRLQTAGIKADSEAIEVLASKVEGNLLAAIQEIEKLKLIAPEQVIDAATMAHLVTDSARFDVFGLIDKTLAGKTAAASVCLAGLRGEGTDAIGVLWAVAREIRTLLALKHALAKGQALESSARANGVFPQRLALIKSALNRLDITTLESLLSACARVDLAVKGMHALNAWDELLNITIRLSGEPLCTSLVQVR